MIKIFMTKGAPASGKSTWAKAEVAKDPENYVRINNDDLRAMLNGSVFSMDYEKFVTDTRNHLVREALKRGKNIILDNVNANKRHFEDVCKIAAASRKDVQVMEKMFYCELDELLARNALRQGVARVPDDIVTKFWKDLGGKQFRHYHVRSEVFQTSYTNESQIVVAPKYVPGVPEAVLCDLDGTLALINGRSPYDASNCDIKDQPNVPVIETILAHYNAGRKIIFCSGREDKYRPETIRFIEKHCLIYNSGSCHPIEYKLFMRKTDDFRKDSIIKEEIYKAEIQGKYNVLLVLDDRTQVVSLWRELGLTCFQVAPGDF